MVEQICFNTVLLDSAKEIFSTMVFMDLVEITEPDVKIDRALLGSITFKGGLEGCLGICCDVQCARAIAVNMLGMDSDSELTEEGTCDAIGEIANMVMGGVKSRILKDVGNLEVSIPSVVSGNNLNNLEHKSKRVEIKISIDDKYAAELSLLYRESL